MIIICEECGKKYQTKGTLKTDKARFQCRQCSHVITIFKEGVAYDQKDESLGSLVSLDLDYDGDIGEDTHAETPSPVDAYEIRSQEKDREAKISNDQEKSNFSDDFKISFGLFPKFISAMLIVCLIPLLIFWRISYIQTENQIRKDTDQILAQTAIGLGDQVNEWMDKNILVLNTAAKLNDIISMSQRQQESILKAIQQEYPWMYLVFTVGIDGMNVARSDGKPLKNYSDRQYYKDIAEGKSLTWQTLIGKTSKKPALVIAVPIVSEGSGLVGVMAAAMNIDEISKRVANWKKGQTGFAFLVDEKRKVVAHQKKDFVLEQKVLETHPLIVQFDKAKKDATIVFEDENMSNNLGHVRGINYGWVLAIQQGTFEIFSPLQKVQRFAWILLIITIVLVTLIAWVLARAVVKPIKQLTDAAERMSLGDLNVEIDIKSKDEVGLLAQAIKRMQTSLSLAVERLRIRR